MFVFVHNENARVPNMAREYGNDFATIYAKADPDEMSFVILEVGRINITELNHRENPCVENDPVDLEEPEMVKGSKGQSVTLEQCIQECNLYK